MILLDVFKDSLKILYVSSQLYLLIESYIFP